MGNGCVGSVQIYGTTYYFSNKEIYNEVISHSGDAATQKTLVDNYRIQYGASAVSTNENDLVMLDEGGSNTGGAQGTNVDTIDYNNWLVNNGLSGISKLSAESKLEDIQAYYEQIASRLSGIMSSIDSALASKDPDTIDACMTELTYNMAALESLSGKSGMGSLIPEHYQGYAVLGSALGIGAVSAATAAGATATLATVAGVSVTIPGIGWVVAGVCAATAIGIGIYNSYKQGQVDDLKEKMQQTMDDCTTKFEYAQKEIGETVDDVVSTVTDSIERLEQSDFGDIKSMNDVFANINGILVFQASIERWSDICEKYGVPFEGEEILEKLGDADNKNKYADEYIVNFVEHTKNAIETSGNVVDDTGTYIASADEVNALISMLFDSEMTRQVNTAPLTELIQFIKEKNQEDVNNDAGAIGDGMYTGNGSYTGDGSYDLGGYSGAFDTAGENKTGVDGAAQDGQYDVDTTKYDEVQKEAQEAAQKDIDEYLDNIKISGKSVGELEELYETTSADLKDFSQYKENLNLDLSGFDTVLSDIRKEQQALVDEYIQSVSVSGKSMSELEQLYGDVSKQGDDFKKASSEVDLSAFDDVLSDIRNEQQSIVDRYADEVSSKVESAGSVAEMARISAEMAQYIDGVSEYDVSTGRISAMNDLLKGKIQAAAIEKATNYEMQATTLKTSDEYLALADAVNIDISEFYGTEVDTSGLQKVAADLISKANALRIEEAKKKADEDAMNVPATMPDTSDTPNDDGTGDNTDEAQTPVTVPAFEGDGPPAYNPEEPPAADGEVPPEGENNGETVPPGGENGENTGNTDATDGEGNTPPEGDVPPTGDVPPAGDASGETEPPLEGTEDPGADVKPPETNAGEGDVPPAGEVPSEGDVPPAEGENPPPPPIPSENGDAAIPPAEEGQEPEGSDGVTSVGQGDSTTPPPNTNNNADETETVQPDSEEEKIPEGEIEQTVEEGLEEGKTPEEIADLIEIEVEE